MLALAAMASMLCMHAGTAKQFPYQAVSGDPMQTRIYTMPNGLTVYLSKNAETPVIQTRIVVRAGSQNDPEESTGLAHYLEHLMFKGTSLYGTTDYAKEKVYLDKIDSLYEVYSATTDELERKSIYHEIDSISYLGSQIAIASEFDKLMEQIGATGVNAFTGNTMTCYVECIPAGELERWAAIESGRFRDLVIRGFHTELETVYEEFNMYSTMDWGKQNLALNQKLYPEISYRQHEVIGTPEHLKNPSIKNVRKFYNTYYRPNNVAICLSGDLDYDHTMEIIDRYFGDWEPNDNLPAQPTIVPNYNYYSAPVDTTVYGLEAENVQLAWRFPSITSEECDIVEMMGEVLYNGKCGLVDAHVVQAQRTLEAWAYPDTDGDYTTFIIQATPKEGQTLEQARQILLDEIELLKKGEFSEDLLKSAILNMRRYSMNQKLSNDYRVSIFTYCHIYGISYWDMLNEINRKSLVTKDDIVRVANKYFNQSYVTVFKRQSDKKQGESIDKPEISPIEMNRDKVSAYRDSLNRLEAEHLAPQYLDLVNDVTRDSLAGRDILYAQNTENELFWLYFISNSGTKKEPELALAANYMDYLGTKSMSAEQLKGRLYEIACDIHVHSYDDQTYYIISGLQESMPVALKLMEQWLTEAKTDNKVYKELVADVIRSHEDSKADQWACGAQLDEYSQYGADQIRQSILTPKQMKSIKPNTLVKKLSDIAANSFRVLYYGPASLEQLKQEVNGCHFMSGIPNTTRQPHQKTQQVNQTEILFAPYDAPNIYYTAYADWGEVYSPKDEAIIMLFNNYFGGSMGSIVFQEMRESRSLAYNASAYFRAPYYAGDTYTFNQFILSQNDKMQQCIETFDSICNNLPVSEIAFKQAKESLIRKIEQRRYVRMAPLTQYMAFEERGWDHDWYKDIYEEVQKLTLEDVVRFQKEHVANRTYRYSILGNKEELDMEYLKTLGPVKELTIDEIFVY